MATVSSIVRPYFKTRLVAAIFSLTGFWICLARVDLPQSHPPEILRQSFELQPPIQNPDNVKVVPSAHPVTPPEIAAIAPEALPDPVLLIDPGHGGADGGMVRNGLIEKDWTLKVGIALAEALKERGHKVELTRQTDATVPLEDRPLLVNAAPRIALLSIHFNAGTPDASGVETWYSWPKKPEIMARLHNAEGVPLPGVMPDDGQRLAMAVQQAVTGRTGARDRGIKNREDLAMTSRTVCPAVLIECGFLSNGSESRKIQDTAYRKKLVEGLADGYEVWLKERKNQPMGPAFPATAVGTILGTQGKSSTDGDAAH